MAVLDETSATLNCNHELFIESKNRPLVSPLHAVGICNCVGVNIDINVCIACEYCDDITC